MYAWPNQTNISRNQQKVTEHWTNSIAIIKKTGMVTNYPIHRLSEVSCCVAWIWTTYNKQMQRWKNLKVNDISEQWSVFYIKNTLLLSIRTVRKNKIIIRVIIRF